MLKHSPPSPLIVDYFGNSPELTAEDAERIRSTLQHHNRVRRIRLLGLWRLAALVDKEFSMSEYLVIWDCLAH
jgi:hypothetical protein